MLRIFSPGYLGALLILQAIEPSFASDWYATDETCCCETNGSQIEVVPVEDEFCGCEPESIVVDDCGCGSMPVEQEAVPVASEPTIEESQKPANGTIESEQPTLESGEALPRAPINVPSTPAADSASDGLFPGPSTESVPPTESTRPTTAEPAAPVVSTPAEVVPPASTPVAEPASEPAVGTADPFDATDTAPESSTEEPAAESTPTDIETESSESVEFDDVFGEPTPDAAGSTPVVEEEAVEEDSTSTESSEESAPATDPLDDLFGPSSAIEVPQGNEQAIGTNRLWTTRDETSHYRGRLVRMTTAGVFVSQPDGGLIVLSYRELSDTDLRFLRTQIQLERDLLATQGDEMQLAVRNSQ